MQPQRDDAEERRADRRFPMLGWRGKAARSIEGQRGPWRGMFSTRCADIVCSSAGGMCSPARIGGHVAGKFLEL